MYNGGKPGYSPRINNEIKFVLITAEIRTNCYKPF